MNEHHFVCYLYRSIALGVRRQRPDDRMAECRVSNQIYRTVTQNYLFPLYLSLSLSLLSLQDPSCASALIHTSPHSDRITTPAFARTTLRSMTPTPQLTLAKSSLQVMDGY